MRGGVKGNRGGQKGRSGRKSKASELGLAELLEECFSVDDRKAVFQNLASIATSTTDPKAAVSAAALLLGYTFGKPTEKHELSGKNGGPIETAATVIIIPDNGREKDRGPTRTTD